MIVIQIVSFHLQMPRPCALPLLLGIVLITWSLVSAGISRPHHVITRAAAYRRECAVTCQVECEMWAEYDPRFCVSECMRSKAAHKTDFEAKFYCYNNMGYWENEFF